MRPIGGYFELELPEYKEFPHHEGVCVNSARNALEVVLRSLPEGIRVYVPRYTCEVVMEPFQHTGTAVEFYDIDQQLELKSLPDLSDDEYLLYTNYFGIKDGYVAMLSERYGSQLIVDDAQAFFHRPTNGSKAVYSPRKFVGVPDGGIAAGVGQFAGQLEEEESYDRCSHLLKRIDLDPGEGYADFKAHDGALVNRPVAHMSKLTRRILGSIDWDRLAEKRKRNFSLLHDALGNDNRLTIPEIEEASCPMVYPYMAEDAGRLRKKLIESQIFVATYWPNVLKDNNQGSEIVEIATDILPLPVDQRYDPADMERIAAVIKES